MPGRLAAARWHRQSQPHQAALCKCVNLSYALQRILGCVSVPAAPHGSPRAMGPTAPWVCQFPKFLSSGVRDWQLELKSLSLLQRNLCLIFIQNLNKLNFEILKPSENETTALCWAPEGSLTIQCLSSFESDPHTASKWILPIDLSFGSDCLQKSKFYP